MSLWCYSVSTLGKCGHRGTQLHSQHHSPVVLVVSDLATHHVKSILKAELLVAGCGRQR